jgi:hypothetical protein
MDFKVLNEISELRAELSQKDKELKKLQKSAAFKVSENTNKELVNLKSKIYERDMEINKLKHVMRMVKDERRINTEVIVADSLMSFKNATEAAEYFNLDLSTVVKACRGINRKCKNKIFRQVYSPDKEYR